MKGLLAVVPRTALSIFDERELELLIGGISAIDVNDWRINTQYRDGYVATSPVRAAASGGVMREYCPTPVLASRGGGE
jgi:hypothetical protein